MTVLQLTLIRKCSYAFKVSKLWIRSQRLNLAESNEIRMSLQNAIWWNGKCADNKLLWIRYLVKTQHFHTAKFNSDNWYAMLIWQLFVSWTLHKQNRNNIFWKKQTSLTYCNLLYITTAFLQVTSCWLQRNFGIRTTSCNSTLFGISGAA